MTRVKNISLRYIQLLLEHIYFKYNLYLLNNIKIILLKRIPYKKKKLTPHNIVLNYLLL